MHLSLAEQLANAGAEVGRAAQAKAANRSERFEPAFERALELFDLTLADPRWDFPRRREIARAREVVCDFLVGDNEFASTAASLDDYFTAFAVAARTRRDEATSPGSNDVDHAASPLVVVRASGR